jgi:ribosomal protein S4
MAKIFKSKFQLVKRYSRYSNLCVYFSKKKVRYGYKLYQKIFKRYKSTQTFRINVRKPRMAVRRKTTFGRALEIKEKFTYLLGGIHASKLQRYCRLSKSKFFSPAQTFASLLERRLDIILYRSNLVSTPKDARLMIKIGCIQVNGKRILKNSFRVSANSTIDLMIPEYVYNKFLFLFRDIVAKNLVFKPYSANLSVSYKLFRIIVNCQRVDLETIFYPFNFNINYFYRLYSI